MSARDSFSAYLMSDGRRYPCCDCCEVDDISDDDEHVNGHIAPCPNGCNDEDGAA